MLQRELIVVELVENPGLLGMWDIDLKKTHVDRTASRLDHVRTLTRTSTLEMWFPFSIIFLTDNMRLC